MYSSFVLRITRPNLLPGHLVIGHPSAAFIRPYKMVAIEFELSTA